MLFISVGPNKYRPNHHKIIKLPHLLKTATCVKLSNRQ